MIVVVAEGWEDEAAGRVGAGLTRDVCCLGVCIYLPKNNMPFLNQLSKNNLP